MLFPDIREIGINSLPLESVLVLAGGGLFLEADQSMSGARLCLIVAPMLEKPPLGCIG